LFLYCVFVMLLGIVFSILIVFCVLVVGTLCVVRVSCVYHWFVVVPCFLSLNNEQRTRNNKPPKQSQDIATTNTINHTEHNTRTNRKHEDNIKLVFIVAIVVAFWFSFLNSCFLFLILWVVLVVNRLSFVPVLCVYQCLGLWFCHWFRF